MISRRTLFAASLAISAILSNSAIALEHKNYTDAVFEAAQNSGKPVLVEISASWCPTCKIQKSILSELTAQPQLKDLIIIEVDYDDQANVVKKLGARSQSTLITFKGGKETSRSVGETRKDAIAAQLKSAI